jgi:hypothetical protein
MDEGRGKYGCKACSVQEQSPHLGAVLTMDGEMFGLAATVTHMMLVLYHNCAANRNVQILFQLNNFK